MGGLASLFGDSLGDNASAFPAALDAWSKAYIGWPIARDVDDKPTGELDTTRGSVYKSWGPRSLVLAVDRARNAVETSSLGSGWFTSVGYADVENASVIPLLDAAKKHIEDAMEYLMDGDFTTPIEDLGDEWWKPRAADAIASVVPDPTAGEATGEDVTAPTTANMSTVYTPHGATAWAAVVPTATDWDNTDVLDVLREFANAMIDDGSVDDIVAKFRGAITAEYTMEAQRATGILYFAGAANTSPAALSFWRRTEEIERQVAAFRAELLNRMYPDPNSIVGIFSALAGDAARIDNTKLQQNQQILQSNISRMDAYLEAAVASASNSTQASINNGQFDTQVSIETFARKIEAEARYILSALEARARVGSITDTTKIELARMIVNLYQNLTTIEQQHASVITELRREWQTNRLKMLMWKIELAETLMNCATIPLGVPMVPPQPSQFETRMAAGIQTFVNVAGTLAPSGNPALAIGGGIVGAALTMFAPRNPGGI